MPRPKGNRLHRLLDPAQLGPPPTRLVARHALLVAPAPKDAQAVFPPARQRPLLDRLAFRNDPVQPLLHLWAHRPASASMRSVPPRERENLVPWPRVPRQQRLPRRPPAQQQPVPRPKDRERSHRHLYLRGAPLLGLDPLVMFAEAGVLRAEPASDPVSSDGIATTGNAPSATGRGTGIVPVTSVTRVGIGTPPHVGIGVRPQTRFRTDSVRRTFCRRGTISLRRRKGGQGVVPGKDIGGRLTGSGRRERRKRRRGMRSGERTSRVV